jgi:hypothetical protein
MLPFVDVVVALEIIDPSASDNDHQIVSGSRGGVASAHKFQALADVRDALAGALEVGTCPALGLVALFLNPAAR